MKYHLFRNQNPQLVEKFRKYQEKHHKLLTNPVVRDFLKEKEHVQMFAQAVCYPTVENREKLNIAFKQFFIEVRLISYLSTLIHRNAINFDKKRRKNSDRCLVILDQPILNSDQGQTTMLNMIPSNYSDIYQSRSLNEFTDNPQLYKALKNLTPNQLKIIEHAYVDELSDTQISRLLGVSQQYVSKTHKTALRIIKDYVKGGDRHGGC